MIRSTKPVVATGWHPDHGFAAVGEIRAGIVDLLITKGFRQSDGAPGLVLLTLPQDTDDRTGRDLIAAANALLLASGHDLVAHSNGPTSQQDEQAQASLTELVPTLQDYRERVLATIRSLHPGVGCLPVPVLSVPEDTAEIDSAVYALNDSLTSVTGDGTPVWMHTERSCNSLSRAAVVVLHALVFQWSAVLMAMRRDLSADGNRDMRLTAQQVALLDDTLRTAAALPVYDHKVTTNSLTQLNPGDVFSVDRGATWQVCSGIPFGAVPVYTGEHDAQGEPVQDSFNAGWHVTNCQVRVPATA